MIDMLLAYFFLVTGIVGFVGVFGVGAWIALFAEGTLCVDCLLKLVNDIK